MAIPSATIAATEATARTRFADEIVGRIERLPILPFHFRVGAILGLGAFFDAFDSLSLVIALTVIVTTLHISFVNVGFLISAAYVGMFFGAILFGYLSEILGRKPTFILSVGIFGALSIGAAFSWDFQSLFWIRFVQGLALGGTLPIAAAMFNEFLPARRRGRIYFMAYAILFLVGIFVAPAVGLLTIHFFGPELGWRALFIVGGLALPLAIAACFWLPELPRWLADKGRVDEADAIVVDMETRARALDRVGDKTLTLYRADVQPMRLGEMFSGVYLRRTILTWTQFFTTYFVVYGYTLWLPTLYVKIGGLPPQDALMLSVVQGAVMLAALIGYGLSVDLVGRKTWFILGYCVCFIGIVFGIVAIGFLHMTAWPVLFAASLLMTCGGHVNASACYLYTAELFPTRMRSWATSTGSASNRVGSFVAPIVIGALLQAGLGIESVFAVLGVLCLTGLIATLAFGIETKQRALEDVSQ